MDLDLACGRRDGGRLRGRGSISTNSGKERAGGTSILDRTSTAVRSGGDVRMLVCADARAQICVVSAMMSVYIGKLLLYMGRC